MLTGQCRSVHVIAAVVIVTVVAVAESVTAVTAAIAVASVEAVAAGMWFSGVPVSSATAVYLSTRQNRPTHV